MDDLDESKVQKNHLTFISRGSRTHWAAWALDVVHFFFLSDLDLYSSFCFFFQRLDENMLPETEKLPADQEVCESDTSISSTDSKEKGYVTSESVLDTSVFFHNYTGTPRVLSTIRHQYSETTPAVQVSTDTQTDVTDVKTKFETSTQTDAKKTVDVGIQVSLPQLTFDDIRGDDQKCVFYTGIPESSTFEALFQEIVLDAEECTGGNRDKSVGGRPRTLRIIDEFFMVLVRLRLGLLLEDLAFRFCVSATTCGEIFNKWIDYLDQKLSFLIMWPSRETIDQEMPDIFKEKFPRTRVIIDCTEIKTETPSSLQLKSVMYSDYKSHMTWKALVGISPSGVPTFTSDLWSGSISDKKITEKSGLLDLCEPGDAIMADKGFLISDLTTSRGIDLIIPPFKRNKKQFSKREVQKTKDIANSRIHVEREMERIKNFRILQGIIPISMAPRVSSIWKICVGLTALQPPLVPQHKTCREAEFQ